MALIFLKRLQTNSPFLLLFGEFVEPCVLCCCLAEGLKRGVV